MPAYFCIIIFKQISYSKKDDLFERVCSPDAESFVLLSFISAMEFRPGGVPSASEHNKNARSAKEMRSALVVSLRQVQVPLRGVSPHPET
jgi:hypothetical protein